MAGEVVIAVPIITHSLYCFALIVCQGAQFGGFGANMNMRIALVSASFGGESVFGPIRDTNTNHALDISLTHQNMSHPTTGKIETFPKTIYYH